jgi:hypothetical protein
MTNDLSAEDVRALLKLEPHHVRFRAHPLSATNELRLAGSQHHFLMAGQPAPPSISW